MFQSPCRSTPLAHTTNRHLTQCAKGTTINFKRDQWGSKGASDPLQRRTYLRNENKQCTLRFRRYPRGGLSAPRILGHKECQMSPAALRVIEGSSPVEKSKALEAALTQIERAFGKG